MRTDGRAATTRYRARPEPRSSGHDPSGSLDRAVKTATFDPTMAQRRLTQRGRDRKQQLMAIAAERFAEGGYHPTSVAEIVEGLDVGDKLRLVPGHCDPTVNLHDWYVGIRRQRVECLWPVAGRGALT